jgi:hypothetical protein
MLIFCFSIGDEPIELRPEEQPHPARQWLFSASKGDTELAAGRTGSECGV